MRLSWNKAGRFLETWIGVLAFAAMFIAIVLQVVFRYLLDDPLVWPFEFSIFCYIYVVYAGAVTAARRRSHVSFDLAYNKMPASLKKFTTIATELFTAFILIVTLPASIEYISMVGGVRSSALSIPWGVVLAAYPLSIGAIALLLLFRSSREAMGYFRRVGLR